MVQYFSFEGLSCSNFEKFTATFPPPVFPSFSLHFISLGRISFFFLFFRSAVQQFSFPLQLLLSPLFLSFAGSCENEKNGKKKKKKRREFLRRALDRS